MKLATLSESDVCYKLRHIQVALLRRLIFRNFDITPFNSIGWKLRFRDEKLKGDKNQDLVRYS